MSYTAEKKAALLKAMSSKENLLLDSLSQLRDVSNTLNTKLTGSPKNLEIKEKLYSVTCKLRYDLELVRSFKEELS